MLLAGNRWRLESRAAFWRVGGAAAPWLIAMAALLLWPAECAAILARVTRHSWVLTLAAGWLAAALTARRRALLRSETSKSWLAAVPVAPLIARAEAAVLATAPVLGAAAAAALWFTSAAAALVSRIPPKSLLAAYGAFLSGLAAGTILSYFVPAARREQLPPGSRYVPKRAARRARSLNPSLAPLGVWAVRYVFASARPQAVARATVPILVLMPLGTFADAAMLVLAIAAVSAALVMLLVATVTVLRGSSRWLQPLPVRRAALARHVVLRPLAAGCICALTLTWLLWAFHTYAGKP